MGCTASSVSTPVQEPSALPANTFSLQHLSAEDVGNLVASVGEMYRPYKPLIVDNGISGQVLASLDDAQTKACLQSVGVTNSVHQTVLCANLNGLKGGAGNNNTGMSPSAPAAPASDRKFHPLPADFKIEEKVTKTPKAIMAQLFEIQGIPVDPTDLDPAVDKIAKAVGGGFGDGISRYDCFINYRVAADADLAEKLYLYLRTKGIHAFLDKKCLKNGEKWKDGFLTGLKNSKCFLALISRKALDRVRDKTGDHTYDNVLLEYETALNIRTSTNNPQFICPLHVGECDGGVLTKFADFNPALYPDSVTALPDAAPAAASTPTPAPVAPSNNNQPNAVKSGGGTQAPQGPKMINVPQPEGTRSIYNPSYYCEIKNICFKEIANNASAILLVVEYNVRGDMSLGPLQDPSSSRIFCGGAFFSMNAIKVYFVDLYQNRGELHYVIPRAGIENFVSSQVTFIFGQGGYSPAVLVVPNSVRATFGAPAAPAARQPNVVNVPQPEGTMSVYNQSYFCAIKSVSLKEIPGNPSAIMFTVEYMVRGDMSLGPLQDPSTSRIFCGGAFFSANSIKVHFVDPFQNRGELHYVIPISGIDKFATNQVTFVFGQGGYSPALLVIPNSAYAKFKPGTR